MTDETIFFQATGSETLQAFQKTAYEQEAILQKALADAPEVIAGFTTTGTGPTKLILISREMPLSLSDAPGTLHIDHLFADALAIPVLVEVKRSSDTRSRRDVVAQMLDYAANANRLWTEDVILAALETQAELSGESADELLSAQGIPMSADTFVRQFGENLADGKIRLMFVSDEIPESLQRIIEFLNGQMTPAEVLAVEVAQYCGSQGTVYVPRLIGGTIAAKDKKAAAFGESVWDEDLFGDAVREWCPPAEAQVIEDLLARLAKANGVPRWGRGKQPGFGALYKISGKEIPLWNVRATSVVPPLPARIEFRIKDLEKHIGIDATKLVKEALKQITGVAAGVDTKLYLSVPLSLVTGPAARQHLDKAIDSMLATSANGTPGKQPQPDGTIIVSDSSIL